MERSINTANRDTVLFVSFAVWLQQIQIKVSILEINVYFWKEPYTRTLTYSISECHMLVNSIEIIRFASACANTACRCVSSRNFRAVYDVRKPVIQPLIFAIENDEPDTYAGQINYS